MFAVPRNPLGLVRYAFRALGRDQVTFRELWLFISFDLRQMPPSKARRMIQQLAEEGMLELRGDWVLLSPRGRSEATTEVEASTPLASLGELLRGFVSSSRLSRAVGMDDTAVEITKKTDKPLRIEAVVHGTHDYSLLLDEETRIISHDCPDWKRTRLLRRFCKHVAKLFLLLPHDDAVRILSSMQREPWQFTLISDSSA